MKRHTARHSPEFRVLGLLVSALFSSASWAQTPPNVSLQQQVDEAFRQNLQAPGDAAATDRYARLLTQSGNYEGAIAALERRLLDPAAPAHTRIELGLLYYRLASYDMAAGLLRRAQQDPRLTPQERSQVNALLSDIAKRTQVSRLDGLLSFGLRAQTNPSARSDADSVLAAGLPVAPLHRPKSDTDLQLGLRLDHRYDLGRQNEATIVSSLSAQMVDYFSSSGHTLKADQSDPYDLGLIDVATGLSFKPAPSQLPGLTLQPRLVAAGLTAQGHRYLSNHGAGLELAYAFNERTLLDAGYEYRYQDYATRIDVPNAAELDGPSNQWRVRLTRELAPGHVISGELRSRAQRTSRRFNDVDSHDLRIQYQLSYRSPLQDGQLWTTSVWAGAQRRSHDAADPAVDPGTARRDNESRLGIGQVVPLTADWSLLAHLEHVNTRSTLPNYRSKNTSLYLAAAYRF